MQSESINWKQWHEFFASRSDRRLPELGCKDDYSGVPDSIAKSLAIFQLGESGGGTIIAQARSSGIDAIDDDYADAVALFVKEEHRHADILAIGIRNLGGSLLQKSWTAQLFVFARRLMGLRLKVMVLLAAEVVGICYYHLLASRLPRSRLTSFLAQIIDDEKAHLRFHASFLRTQTYSTWRRAIFVCAWRSTMFMASIVVLIDHRKAMRDLGLTRSAVLGRWNAYSKLAEDMVVGHSGATGSPAAEMFEEQTSAVQPLPGPVAGMSA